MENEDSRYPYTHSCDFIRMLGGYDEGGLQLSRSNAYRIRQAIAKAIGMDDEELASKLANAQLAKTKADYQEETDELTKALFTDERR